MICLMHGKSMMENRKYWGYSTHIDLYDCNPEYIRDKVKIKEYVDVLCKNIKMKKFGDCVIEHFGESEHVKGYTFVQMIETSLISGHLVESTNQAHIDIFSCKVYLTEDAAIFTQEYFQSKKIKFKVLYR